MKTKEMGFDSSLLKSTLEQFVDDIAEESSDLIVERPRFAYAVVVVADDEHHELCQASCVRQLDVDVQESVIVSESYEDEEILRALRELQESKQMLDTREQNGNSTILSVNGGYTNGHHTPLSDIQSQRPLPLQIIVRFFSSPLKDVERLIYEL